MAEKRSNSFRFICAYVIAAFLASTVSPLIPAQAAELNLPGPREFVPLSPDYSFPVLKGLKIDPSDPLRLEFIVDTADKARITEQEASSLIKYFLAALTIPEEDIWVNLSPYEEDKVTPALLGQTDLGKDLLSQDYLLKQLTSSLTYPESSTGKDFWETTYQEVAKITGTANIPINTFNKIWIVPQKAHVYENGNVALITEAKLEAMLEQDYLTLKNKASSIQKESKDLSQTTIEDINQASSNVMKEQVLPKINQEVNKGKNFATLRQIYHSLILGIWFKQKFKESLYAHYIDEGKISGIDLKDSTAKDQIYDLYVSAFKKGIYNYIKTDYDSATRKNIKRRYYSGGFSLLRTPAAPTAGSALNATPSTDWFTAGSSLGETTPRSIFTNTPVIIDARITPELEGGPATAGSALKQTKSGQAGSAVDEEKVKQIAEMLKSELSWVFYKREGEEDGIIFSTNPEQVERLQDHIIDAGFFIPLPLDELKAILRMTQQDGVDLSAEDVARKILQASSSLEQSEVRETPESTASSGVRKIAVPDLKKHYEQFLGDGFQENIAKVASLAVTQSPKIRSILQGREGLFVSREERVVKNLVEALRGDKTISTIRVSGEPKPRFQRSGKKGEYEVVIAQEDCDLEKQSSLSVGTMLGIYDRGNIVSSLYLLNGPITTLVITDGSNISHYAYDGSQFIKRDEELDLSRPTDKNSVAALGGVYSEWDEPFQEYFWENGRGVPGSSDEILKTRYSGVLGEDGLLHGAIGANLYQVLVNNGFLSEIVRVEVAKMLALYVQAGGGEAWTIEGDKLKNPRSILLRDADAVQFYGGNRDAAAKLKGFFSQNYAVSQKKHQPRQAPTLKRKGIGRKISGLSQHFGPQVSLESFLTENMPQTEEREDVIGAVLAVADMSRKVGPMYISGGEETGKTDSGDAAVRKIDEETDILFQAALIHYVGAYYSEDTGEVEDFPGIGERLRAVIDPLDGSTLVEANGGGGTILALRKLLPGVPIEGQTGKEIVASLIISYGINTKMIIGVEGMGAYEFVLEDGTFYKVREIKLDEKVKKDMPLRIALGGTRSQWPQGFPELVDKGIKEDAINGYSGAFVTDVYGAIQHILNGGEAIFAYLAPKLRPRSELQSVAYIFKVAGGADLTYDKSIISDAHGQPAFTTKSLLSLKLTHEPDAKHQQRAPSAFGGKGEIGEVKSAISSSALSFIDTPEGERLQIKVQENGQRRFYSREPVSPEEMGWSTELRGKIYENILIDAGKIAAQGETVEIEMPKGERFRRFLVGSEENKKNLTPTAYDQPVLATVGGLEVRKYYHGEEKFFQMAYTAENGEELLLTFKVSRDPLTDGVSAILQPFKQVTVIGAGTIGMKGADLVRETGFFLRGVINTAAVDEDGRPKLFTNYAVLKGYDLYVPPDTPKKSFKDNLRRAQEAGLPYKGSAEDLFGQLRGEGKKISVIDASPGGKKAKETRSGWLNKENLYDRNRDVIETVLYMGAEDPSIAQRSFSFATAVWEKFKGLIDILVVSCNSTGLNRVNKAILDAFKAAGIKSKAIFTTIPVRRERDPGVKKEKIISDEIQFQMAVLQESRELEQALGIPTNVNIAKTSAKQYYLNTLTITAKPGTDVNDIRALLERTHDYREVLVAHKGRDTKELTTEGIHERVLTAQENGIEKPIIVVNVMPHDPKMPDVVKVAIGYDMNIVNAKAHNPGTYGIIQALKPLKSSAQLIEALNVLIEKPGSQFKDQTGGLKMSDKHHTKEDVEETLTAGQKKKIESFTQAGMAPITHFHIHVGTLKTADIKIPEQRDRLIGYLMESVKQQKRLAAVSFQDDVFSSAELFEAVNSIIGHEVLGGSHPGAVFVSVLPSQIPNQIEVIYAVPQESDVVPEIVNALQAALGLYPIKEEAGRVVDEVWEMDRIKNIAERVLPVKNPLSTKETAGESSSSIALEDDPRIIQLLVTELVRYSEQLEDDAADLIKKVRDRTLFEDPYLGELAAAIIFTNQNHTFDPYYSRQFSHEVLPHFSATLRQINEDNFSTPELLSMVCIIRNSGHFGDAYVDKARQIIKIAHAGIDFESQNFRLRDAVALAGVAADNTLAFEAREAALVNLKEIQERATEPSAAAAYAVAFLARYPRGDVRYFRKGVKLFEKINPEITKLNLVIEQITEILNSYSWEDHEDGSSTIATTLDISHIHQELTDKGIVINEEPLRGIFRLNSNGKEGAQTISGVAEQIAISATITDTQVSSSSIISEEKLNQNPQIIQLLAAEGGSLYWDDDPDQKDNYGKAVGTIQSAADGTFFDGNGSYLDRLGQVIVLESRYCKPDQDRFAQELHPFLMEALNASDPDNSSLLDLLIAVYALRNPNIFLPEHITKARSLISKAYGQIAYERLRFRDIVVLAGVASEFSQLHENAMINIVNFLKNAPEFSAATVYAASFMILVNNSEADRDIAAGKLVINGDYERRKYVSGAFQEMSQKLSEAGPAATTEPAVEKPLPTRKELDKFISGLKTESGVEIERLGGQIHLTINEPGTFRDYLKTLGIVIPAEELFPPPNSPENLRVRMSKERFVFLCESAYDKEEAVIRLAGDAIDGVENIGDERFLVVTKSQNLATNFRKAHIHLPADLIGLDLASDLGALVPLRTLMELSQIRNEASLREIINANGGRMILQGKEEFVRIFKPHILQEAFRKKGINIKLDRLVSKEAWTEPQVVSKVPFEKFLEAVERAGIASSSLATEENTSIDLSSAELPGNYKLTLNAGDLNYAKAFWTESEALAYARHLRELGVKAIFFGKEWDKRELVIKIGALEQYGIQVFDEDAVRERGMVKYVFDNRKDLKDFIIQTVEAPYDGSTNEKLMVVPPELVFEPYMLAQEAGADIFPDPIRDIVEPYGFISRGDAFTFELTEDGPNRLQADLAKAGIKLTKEEVYGLMLSNHRLEGFMTLPEIVTYIKNAAKSSSLSDKYPKSLTAAEHTTYGGIDMNGIGVEATPGSSPVTILPFDPARLKGFSFQIISIEDIEDLDRVLALPQTEGAPEMASLN